MFVCNVVTRMSTGIMLMLFPLGVFGAAVFAEPAITEIEKVVGLIHGSGWSEIKQSLILEAPSCRSVDLSSETDPRNDFPVLLRFVAWSRARDV